jgi:DNA gyrase subunit A
MQPSDAVVGMAVICEIQGTLLTITRSGFGKRTSLSEYPVKGRGGQGVITIKNTAKLGDVVGIQLVDDADHLLILTSGGKIIRLRMEEISVIGRNTMGRTLVRMEPGEQVVDVARAEPSEEDQDIEDVDDADTTEDPINSEPEDDEEPGQS